MHIISGGVTAPKGFQAAGIHCGIKDNFTTPQPEKKDLAMILSAVPCAAAGTFTRNVVKADPVILTREHLADHKAQGIIFDSGNANACAPKGMENAQRMAQAAAGSAGGRFWTGAGWHLQGGFPARLRAGARLSPEKAGGKSAGGKPPGPPPFIARSLLARSFWRWKRSGAVVGLFRNPCTCPDLGTFFYKKCFSIYFSRKCVPNRF